MILKPAKFATRGANPIGAVLISWFLVQVGLVVLTVWLSVFIPNVKWCTFHLKKNGQFYVIKIEKSG